MFLFFWQKLRLNCSKLFLFCQEAISLSLLENYVVLKFANNQRLICSYMFLILGKSESCCSNQIVPIKKKVRSKHVFFRRFL